MIRWCPREAIATRDIEYEMEQLMYKGNAIGVVIPAYNEAGFVGEVIETVPSFVDRVYAVDDCSSDNTWAEIQVAADRINGRRAPETTATTDGGTQFPTRVVPMQLERNRGVGGAIKTGYRKALEDGIDVIAVMNGDGQMDPDILDQIIDPVVEGEADYAKGNRLRRREYRTSMPRWRLFGNSLLTFLTKIASGYLQMMDPQNGYTAISRDAVEAINLETLYESYGFCNDVLVRLNVHGFTIADVDMPALYGDEESQIRYRTFVPLLSMLLLRRFFWRLGVRYLVFDFHPLVLLYGLGAVSGLIGLAFGGYAVFESSSLVHGGIALTNLIFAATLLVLAMVFDREHGQEQYVQI